MLKTSRKVMPSYSGDRACLGTIQALQMLLCVFIDTCCGICKSHLLTNGCVLHEEATCHNTQKFPEMDLFFDGCSPMLVVVMDNI